MKKLIKQIEEASQENQALLLSLEQLLGKSPEGRIEVTTSKGKPRFFLIKGGMRRYLRREETWLIQSLLEKQYFKKMLLRTRKNQEALDHFLKEFEPDVQARIYENMSPHRRHFVKPLVEPDAMYAERWLEEHRAIAAARPNTFQKSGEFITMNGEVVRSKSEKIIADLLYQLGIPYVYECPLDTPGGLVYPDFTILDINNRRVYYWEHRGRLDNLDYVENNIWKTHLYAAAGVFPGYNLLLSEETGDSPLRTKDVEAMIRAVFL